MIGNIPVTRRETTNTRLAVVGSSSFKANAAIARQKSIVRSVLAALTLTGGVSIAHADDNSAASPTNPNAIGIGAEANPSGINSIAIGLSSSAADESALAVGIYSSASSKGAVALGLNASAMGVDSIAAGAGATAARDAAAAFGSLASASGFASTALGYNAQSSGASSLAAGMGSSAAGMWSVAIGVSASASTANSVALGAYSTTTADLTQSAFVPTGANATLIAAPDPSGEVSLGSANQERRLTNLAAGAAPTDAVNVSQLSTVDSKVDALAQSATQRYFKATGDSADDAAANGTHALAAGAAASATADDAAAVGAGASAIGIRSTALGAHAAADATEATSIGASAMANGPGATAIGAHSTVTGDGSVALGYGASAGAGNSVALGQNSVADRADTVSVGSAGQQRQLTNVAAGTEASDAVNLSQLQAVSESASRYFKANGNGLNDDSDNASATGINAIAIGSSALASGETSFAAGAGSLAQGDLSTALGGHALAQGEGATALGFAANAVAANSVALGQDSIADRAGTVSVGSAGHERQITNVAAGAADTDAVNVAQLKTVSDQSATTAARLDGAVMYDQNTDNSVNRNSVTLGGDAASGGTVIHNVADGVSASDAVNLGQLNEAVNGAVSNVIANVANPLVSAQGDPNTESAVASGTHAIASGANAQATGTNTVALGTNSIASGANATALGAATTASADNSVALGQGSVADRANTVSVGAAGQERQITNVAAGSQGTDAVNVNQLQQSVGGAVSQANSYTDDQIRSARRDAYGGTASALAMAGLPQAVLPGHGMVSMAGGTYGGQSALAIGVSQLSDTGKWVYKMQGTTDSRGQFGASIGAGMHW